VIQYKVDDFYDRSSERGILLSDPELNIDWRLGDIPRIISEKDMKNPTFSKAENNF